MTTSCCVRSCATLVLALLAASPLSAQTPAPERRTVPAVRLADGERITLDGRFEEPVWARITPAADFIQVDPNNGRPATEPTEVRVAFTDDAIYLGVTCFDSEPDRWLGYQRRRDEFLAADDRFMWTIDTFLDARSGYFFEMNPSGLMADSIFGVNGDNRAWDGIWNARVRHSEIGWTIEIEIPFKTLNFNPESDTWGMNFQRTVRRKNEDSIWMGWARNQGLRRMANAGYVTGISNVSQGIGLDLKPYALYRAQASPGRGASDFDHDGNVGVDLFYNPTPLLRTNLTVNTDFAQTEVDQRQVNLTRFSLFFPERRDFFLDGAIFFDFGSPTAPQNSDLRINPFFSRRIGLSAAGTPQKIDYGTKVMGQLGGQDVGLLHVRTGDEGAFIGEEFTVARVKRRVMSQSYFGAMYTRRDPRITGAETQHTAGADFRLATNRFRGNQNLEATGWFLRAEQPGASSGGNAFGGSLAYPNDLWNLRVDANEVQEAFDPGIGFVTRRNYRRYAPSVTFGPRPDNHPYIRRVAFTSNIDIQTDLHNAILQRSADLTLAEVTMHSGDVYGVEMSINHERLDAPFRLAPGIELPIGSAYDFNRYLVRAQTANRRVLSVNASYGWGEFYSGDRKQTSVVLNVRARPGYIVYLTGEWNHIELPEGEFTTKLYRVVGEAQFSPWLAWVNNIQYDTQSAVLGWQSRFRWIVRPGNDLYVVYTHNWLDDPVLNRFATLDKNVASKVLYTHRF